LKAPLVMDVKLENKEWNEFMWDLGFFLTHMIHSSDCTIVSLTFNLIKGNSNPFMFAMMGCSMELMYWIFKGRNERGEIECFTILLQETHEKL